MAISLTDINPPTYSNLGDVWLSVSGTGFQDPLNRITNVTAYCGDHNITRQPTYVVLSDSLMIIWAPSATDLQADLPAFYDYRSEVIIEVHYDSLDDFGKMVPPPTGGQHRG